MMHQASIKTALHIFFLLTVRATAKRGKIKSMSIHRGIGRIRYYDDYVVCEISQGIVDFYFSLIPKAWYPKSQANRAHITVSRLGKERPNKRFWKYRNGDLVDFFYDSYVYFSHPYFFLKAQSEDIMEIREKLSLPQYRHPYNCYHISIGNVKEQK